LDERKNAQGHTVEVGKFRTQEVQVGRHIAPKADSVPLFLSRWQSFYSKVRAGEASLLAIAASHQRLGWIHPYTDGNGRVMRLHTHALLFAQGYTNGLWSPLRGFARNTERYYALLANADLPRQGDLDGRGNLSEAHFITWINFVLDMCIDQVRFMQGMLKLGTMPDRIAACLAFEHQIKKNGIRPEALHPLHYLWLSGNEMPRGEFKAMLGLGDRIATDVLSALIKRGLLKSHTPQGAVRFGIPLHALRFYFPALWTEAEADVAE
jgi:hypothetical protein